ncbi:helix-turn-helix domain-containing protein [Methylorubrum populi]|uniref:helix-turn-helix domain-containing protein n=1 Tax=Methylorubrum TaxID=2282523 RepID=UPI00114E9875|nr:helix-turn-helix transcriptional regulator [Methylorubrum populi]QDI79034.1 helix-turn-helix transcriptional regulator [Methylorubrum populi]
MKAQDIIERIAAMPPRQPGVAEVPPIELVAMVTRMGRGLRQWKKETLADFARVSLSTVERVERAEPVGAESLDRIARALGYEPGAFTEPRIPIPREQAATEFAEEVGHLEPVEVRPFLTHRQVRLIGGTQAFLIHRPDLGTAYDEQVEGLQEWLDLVSMAMGPHAPAGSEPSRRRDLCNDVLAAVAEFRRRGVTVLAGVIDAPPPGIPEWKVAIISLTPRLSDPGAPKRRTILVDRRCVQPGPGYLPMFA